MKKTLSSGLTLVFILTGIFLYAKEPADSIQQLIERELKKRDSIENSLHYQKGKINLGSGIAEINVPDGFKFLGPEETDYVLYELWGNLRRTSRPLGLLFPENSGATDIGGYAFVIQYEAIGYVKDKDADKINYDELLEDMKKSSEKSNEERKKAGLLTMNLVGWAAKPFYDKERKILHWAKEFKVEDSDGNALNYDIRILGRKGILNLQAISDMSQLDSVNQNIETVLGMVSFNEGHRYSDFNSKTDEVAAWTIGGLVAGKILAKAGFFALILKNIKLVLLGLVAIGGGIWKFVTGRRKKSEEEMAYASTGPENTDNNPQS